MTLVRTIQPMPDESLPGLVARAAGANIYPYAHDVLVQLGRHRLRPESIATQPADLANDLAQVLGTDSVRLHPLFHPVVEAGFVDFFGTPLRSIYRERQRRRVSPRALKAAGYVRAVWSVRPLSFDPATLEMLIDCCPECGGVLGFTKTWGVEFCEHCLGDDEWGLPASKVDLRDFPQPIVETNDQEALEYVVSLIDPSGAETRQRHHLHEDLEVLTRGDLFQLALSLAAANASMQGGERSFLAGKKDPRRPIDPHLLARCGRVLLDWPRGLKDLCEEARRGAAKRAGEWGRYKEFGALAALPNDEFLRPMVQQVVRAALDKVFGDFSPTNDRPLVLLNRPIGEFVTSTKLREATSLSTRVCARLASHPRVLSIKSRGSSLQSIAFPVWQVEPIARHVLDMAAEVNVSTTLGLPPDAVRDLASVDFIHAKDSGYALTAVDVHSEPGRYYSQASVDRLVDVVCRGMKFKKTPPAGYVPLSDAMLMFPAGRRPWLPVLMRILFENVPAMLHDNVADKPKVTGLFQSVSVKGLDLMRAEIMEDHSSARAHDIERVSAVAAGLMLGCPFHEVLVGCAEAKLLKRNPDKSFSYDSVLDLSRRFIFTNEAAARLGVRGRDIAPLLADYGVGPKHRFIKGVRLFSRDEVEPLLNVDVPRSPSTR